MTKVSVIIPTHNRVSLVQRAISSVLAQTFTDYEIIVVDDGSIDDTGEVIKSRFPGVRYFCAPHRGASAARNVGLSHAFGEYIAFLDSDDVWTPRKLAVQVAVMDDNWEVVLSHTSYVRIVDNRESKTIHSGLFTGNVYNRAVIRCPIALPTVMVRKSFLDVGFNEDIRAGEDVVLWAHIALQYPILGINEPLAVISVNSHSHSQSATAQVEGVSNILKQAVLRERIPVVQKTILGSACAAIIALRMVQVAIDRVRA